MKTSFFRKYFMYKSRGFRGLEIAAAVLNFAALLLPTLIFFNVYSSIAFGFGYDFDIEAYLMIAALAAAVALIVITAITPVLSFKFYNNRAAMDTLGCLPLSYKERFFGDFLSGLAADLITFIPFSVIGIIVVAITQNTVFKQVWEQYRTLDYIITGMSNNPLKIYIGYVVLMFFVYVGTYVISTFVTSCCGRVGSSILYSAIAMIAPAGLVSQYGMSVLGGAVGVYAKTEINKTLMAIPPAGMFLGTILASFNEYGFDSDMFLASFANILSSPIYIVSALIIIAAFFVGSYYLGKHRKAERVDRDFVYNGTYHVIALALAAAVIGFYFNAFPDNSAAYKSGDVHHIIFSAAAGLAIYIVMELGHLRSAKKLPMSLLRYAGLYAVCFAFLFVSYKTDGFGVETRLPDKNKISSIEIEGTEFFVPGTEQFVYSSEEAIDSIYSGHEKLLQNRDILNTGSMVILNYVMSNGTEFHREYSSDSDAGKAIVKSVCADIRENEPDSGLRFIGTMRYDRIVSIIYHNDRTDETYYVKPEAVEELAEALKFDLLRYGDKLQTGSIGTIDFTYELNGVEEIDGYLLNEAFSGTLAAIMSNAITDTVVSEDEEYTYYINYYPANDEETRVITRLTLDLANTDERESAKAVMKYIATTNDVPEEERSSCWKIYSGSYYYDYCVRKTDDGAMLKAVLELAEDITN